METIIYKEKFLDCPYCSTPIGSMAPTCSQCGLEVSGEGIEELGENEEQCRLALEEANYIFGRAGSLIFCLVGSYLYFRLVPFSIILTLVLSVFPPFYFAAKFYVWHRKNASIPDKNEDFAQASRLINVSKAIVLLSYSALFIFLFVNWKQLWR